MGIFWDIMEYSKILQDIVEYSRSLLFHFNLEYSRIFQNITKYSKYSKIFGNILNYLLVFMNSVIWLVNLSER